MDFPSKPIQLSLREAIKLGEECCHHPGINLKEGEAILQFFNQIFNPVFDPEKSEREKSQQSWRLKLFPLNLYLVSWCLNLWARVWNLSENLNWQNPKERKGGGAVSFLSWYLKLLSTCFSFKPCYIYGDIFKWWNLLYFQVILSSDQTCYVAMNIFFTWMIHFPSC